MDEVAHVRVAPEPLDAAEVLGRLSDATHGAQLLFVGVVRSDNLGRKVVAVSYDAFGPLAEKTLRDICLEARTKWGEALRLEVVHRTGRLLVGEASVIVAVGSGHRSEAYEASRYVLEQLKVRVPIWKKEHYESGDSEWLRGHELGAHGRVGIGGGPLDANGTGQGEP